MAGRRERRRQEEKEVPFEAFSTMELFLVSFPCRGEDSVAMGEGLSVLTPE